MNKQNELNLIKQFTGASDDLISVNEIGWTSRVYLIDGGRIVFKFPRNAKEQKYYAHEIKVLKLIKEHKFNLDVPVINWLGENNEYIGFYGVKGASLKPEMMHSFNDKQKESLGNQIGVFLKKLHSIEGFTNPNEGTDLEQLKKYQKWFLKTKNVFKYYFNDEEMNFIEELFMQKAPDKIKVLGSDIVFCHGDFGYNNILIDDNFSAGVIDFGDAGLYDRSKDFIDLDDKTVLRAALKAYGGNEMLLEKITIWQKILPVFLMLFHINRKKDDWIDYEDGIMYCVEKIKKIKALESCEK